MARPATRAQRDWALYDWANSAFSTTVIAGFFPLFFKAYWAADLEATTSTFWLGIANSGASLTVLLLAPLLGALADVDRSHRRWLGLFASAGIAATIAFFFLREGQWQAAALVYALAVIGWSGANVFYDAMLPALAEPPQRHRLSAFGFALGYLGGGLLFLVNVAMTLKPAWFGLQDAGEAVRYAFLSVAVWWAVFALPLLLNRDASIQGIPVGGNTMRFGQRVVSVTRGLANTAREIKGNRNLLIFLVGYWLYIDGVATIIRMAVDYGMAIGLPSNSLITALLLVQFIGFPATLFFGRVSERIGARTSLLIALGVYLLATIAAAFMSSALEFYALAVALGLVQGAVQALSRSLFSQLIPIERSGEFYGFLNMLGKSAAVLGPVLVGVVAATTGSPRIGILSIIFLFAGGMFFLARVHEPKAVPTDA